MTHYKPLCPDAWAIPPTPIMLKHGNSYHTCSKCGEPVETVNLKDAAMTTPLSNNINDRADDIKRQHISKLSNADELREQIAVREKINREVEEILGDFVTGSLRLALVNGIHDLITSQKAIWSIEGFMLGQGYRFVEAPGVRAKGYYEKSDDDGNSTVCNEYTAEKRYEKALDQLSTEDVKES